MPLLFGKKLTRRELQARSDFEQFAGWTRSTREDGFERGVETLHLRTGGGLSVTFCPSRGLDVFEAEWNGTPLVWRGPNGLAHPAFYSAENFDWLRGFAGGLLTTCGLQNIGPSCEEEGERFSLHDRIAYTPAREVAAQTVWDGDECEFQLRGTLRQTRLFGTNLRLERSFSARLGENRLRLRDQITNDGFEPCPLLVLYHCNFGWPLLDEGTRVLLNAIQTTPRDDDARVGTENWAQIEAPQVGWREQVFFHELERDQSGDATAALWNPRLNLGVSLRFGATLSHLTQWKQSGAGAYVLGLEPSNAPLASRAELRERGELPMLDAGETRVFELEWEIIEHT